MKKTYMTPALFVQKIAPQQMVCSSLNTVGGDSDIEKGEPEVPGGTPISGDSRRWDVWYDDESEE